MSKLYRTERRRFGATWVEATFGVRAIGTHPAYLSLTGVEFAHPTSRNDQYWLACGQIRESILGAFPELAPLAPWHLCTDGQPMHYKANAKFWYDGVHGLRALSSYEPDMHRAFARTVALGVLDTDPDVDSVLALPWEQVAEFLEIRLPAMRTAFRELVSKLPALASATRAVEVDE